MSVCPAVTVIGAERTIKFPDIPVTEIAVFVVRMSPTETYFVSPACNVIIVLVVAV